MIIEPSLSIPMDQILQRLNILNGFIKLLTHQLDIFQKTFKQSYEDRGVNSDNVFAGFALLIPDLTVQDENHFINFIDAGVFQRQGDEYFKAGEELVSNWSAWTVAQSYEAFETFLRDIAAYYYFICRPGKPIGNLKQMPIEAENIDAWKGYFRERQWDPKSIFKILRLSEPTIVECEKSNKLHIDLQQWFLLFTSVRHAITHSNSRLSRDDITATPESINHDLPIEFPGIWEDDIYNIKFSEKNSWEIIRITGAYAYIIYKKLCVGSHLNLDIDIIK